MNKENFLFLIIGFAGGILAGIPAFIFLIKKSVAFIARATANDAAADIVKTATVKIQAIDLKTQCAVSESTVEMLKIATQAIDFLKEYIKRESPEKTVTARAFAKDAVEKRKSSPPAAKLTGDFYTSQNFKPFGDEKFSDAFSNIDDPIAEIATDVGLFDVAVATYRNAGRENINGEVAEWFKCFICRDRTGDFIAFAYFPRTVDVRRFEENPTEFILDLHCLFTGEVLGVQGSLRFCGNKPKRAPEPQGRGAVGGSGYGSLLEKQIAIGARRNDAGRCASCDFETNELFFIDRDGLRFCSLCKMPDMMDAREIAPSAKVSDTSDTAVDVMAATSIDVDEYAEKNFSSIYHFDKDDLIAAVEFKDWVDQGAIEFEGETLLIYSARFVGKHIDEAADTIVGIVRDSSSMLIEDVFVPAGGEFDFWTIAMILQMERNETGKVARPAAITIGENEQ